MSSFIIDYTALREAVLEVHDLELRATDAVDVDIEEASWGFKRKAGPWPRRGDWRLQLDRHHRYLRHRRGRWRCFKRWGRA